MFVSCLIMQNKTAPLKMKEAMQLISAAGGTIHQGKKHKKITHPNHSRVFTLPVHGSKGRSTISPGMSADLRKYLKECTM